MSRLRSALLATALVAPALTGAVLTAGAAHADPSADDVAAQVITVTQADKKGDVRLTKKGKAALNKNARASVDLTKVEYVVDRVQNLVTITYTTRHKPVAVKGAQTVFVTVADADASDPQAPFAVIMSRAGKPGVQVMTTDAPKRCADATIAGSDGGRVRTVTAPFSCLGGLEHAHLMSAVDLSARRADLGFDLTKRTRDLPLTTYVDPTA